MCARRVCCLPVGRCTSSASFDRDEASFRASLAEAVRWFGRAVVRQVCATRSAVHAAALLAAVSALPLARRPVLAEIVAALQVRVAVASHV